jgi:eIF-2B alpha/beta/delta-related uncharacterized proteins
MAKKILLRTPKEIIDDIKNLKIQGARRIAKAAIDAIIWQVKNSNAKTKDELYDEIVKLVLELENTRPTEPMMRNSLENALRFMMSWINIHQQEDIEKFKEDFLEYETNFLEEMDQQVERIAEFGSSLIKNGYRVLIHCHSSTVIKILQTCHDQEKDIEVSCLETRPLYQGRLSARELAEYGIKTKLYVDSAMGSIIQKHDLVLVGADAITAQGDLINKVGTYTLAQIARLNQIKFFSAAEIYKYNPLTKFGIDQQIEKRSEKEIWGDGLYAMEKSQPIPIPKNLSIENIAFDLTPFSLINAYITEEGIIPPQMIIFAAEKKLRGEKI